MTEAVERALLRDYLATCARLARGFGETVGLAAHLLPVQATRIDDLPVADETLVLAYLKRFEQFEDALHRTLEAVARAMEHGKVERLTSIDVTRRAYALGILDEETAWADAARARNALASEYPLNPAKRAAQLNAAWSSRITLAKTWEAIGRFVEQEGLLR